MKSFLITDIETRIAKSLVNATQYPGQGLTDDEAYQAYRQDLKDTRGSDFLPVLYHVPISIAVGVVEADYQLGRVTTLGVGMTAQLLPHTTHVERCMVEHFWQLVNDGYTLVTVNGRSFDLPVLELAALRYGLQAPKYWVTGTKGPRYRYSDDYHYDVADVLSNSGAVPKMPLNDLLLMLGYAGKGEVDGSMVQAMHEAGQHEAIHAYCQRDVIQTYMLFLRLELIRGRLTQAQYAKVCKAADPWLQEMS